ncbi:MAG: arylesterase, partial [Pseudomonas sp.]
QQNLSAMVTLAENAGADVILLGMRIPPNYGPRYSDAFEKVFTEVADEHDVALVPFLLEGVGGVEGLMQSDGVHPTAAAQAILLDNAWPSIKQWLRQ